MMPKMIIILNFIKNKKIKKIARKIAPVCLGLVCYIHVDN